MNTHTGKLEHIVKGLLVQQQNSQQSICSDVNNRQPFIKLMPLSGEVAPEAAYWCIVELQLFANWASGRFEWRYNYCGHFLSFFKL